MEPKFKNINQKYDIIQPPLKRDSIGTTLKVKMDLDNKGTKIYILKKIYYDYHNDIQKEMEILSRINSNYVVKTISIFSENDTFLIKNIICLVNEFCNGGNLKDKIMNGDFNEQQLWTYFIRVSLGLYHIHYNKLIHRNLKPENILLNDGVNVKLCDFGLPKVIETVKGKVYDYEEISKYMAPEILFHKEYNFKSDIWSFGCIFFELLFGMRENDFFIKVGQNKKEIPEIGDELLTDFISKMIVIDYTKRLSIIDIISNKTFISKALKYNLLNEVYNNIYKDNKVLYSLYYDKMGKSMEDLKQLSEKTTIIISKSKKDDLFPEMIINKYYGFFINYEDNIYLITNNLELNDLRTQAGFELSALKNQNDNLKELNLKNKYCFLDLPLIKDFSSRVSIIQVKMNKNYFEIDDEFSQSIKENRETNRDICIFSYPSLNNLNKDIVNQISTNIGKILKIEGDLIYHNINISKENNKLLPIINLNNNKIVGINCIDSKNNNIGISINYIKNQIDRNILCKTVRKLIELWKEENNNWDMKKHNKIIDDITISSKIFLSNSDIDDEQLNLIGGIHFNNLKFLSLEQNRIFNIDALAKDYFKNLEILNIGKNQIKSINALSKVKFQNLLELFLNNNEISNIDVLTKDVFANLEILNLGHNNIGENISALKSAKFNKLRELNIRNNKISSLVALINENFKNLEILNISYNKLGNNVNALKEAKFIKLRELIINNNDITNIDGLINEAFSNLEILNLSDNHLGDNINVLKAGNFSKLKSLILKGNEIFNIDGLNNDNFKTLEVLDLRKNKIGNNINVLKEAKLFNIIEINLSQNGINNVEALSNDNFKTLESLDLGNNKLENNISVLQEAKFTNLKKLYLSQNGISNIDIFSNNDVFNNLEILNLSENKIGNNVSSFKDAKFFQLKKLYLNKNEISQIDVFTSEVFKNIEYLNLGENKIGNNISILTNAKFTCLKELILSQNGVTNIQILKKVKAFENCRIYYLNDLRK